MAIGRCASRSGCRIWHRAPTSARTWHVTGCTSAREPPQWGHLPTPMGLPTPQKGQVTSSLSGARPSPAPTLRQYSSMTSHTCWGRVNLDTSRTMSSISPISDSGLNNAPMPVCTRSAATPSTCCSPTLTVTPSSALAMVTASEVCGSSRRRWARVLICTTTRSGRPVFRAVRSPWSKRLTSTSANSCGSISP